MKAGDQVLFYASVTTKAVLGIAKVTKTAFPDPTAEEDGWSAVELQAENALPHSVSLEQIKAEPALKDIALLRQSRLSVMPLAPSEFKKIVSLGRS